MKRLLTTWGLAFLTVSFTAAQSQPEIFAEGVISKNLDELNAAFTPDGKTVYFSVNSPGGRLGVIAYSELKGSTWSEPQIASFSGQYIDYDPFITADGKKLFYCSNRSLDGKPKQDFDIFYVERTPSGWGEPRSVGSMINDGKNQYYPALSTNGNLYYNSNSEGGYDLYVAKWKDGQFQKPEKLKGKVNSDQALDGDAIIAPDESFIIFVSYGRPDTMGSGDLYISYRENDEWSEPKNLGAPVNSTSREYCPILSPDGKKFFFTSFRGELDKPLEKRFSSFSDVSKLLNSTGNGLGNVYSIDSNQVLKK